MRQRSVWPQARGWLGGGVILIAALVALLPQLIRGNSCGHDFDFHLISWLDAQTAWRMGIPYPHWTPSANYGAGEPRFVFYPPLTWMLGAALGFALPWTLVPVALTFLLLAGTGLATRALARQALSEAPATLAGCTAIFSGYALFTAYERTAFAELAGGLWIPLVLLFSLRDETAPGESSLPSWRRALDGSSAGLAVAMAGAWLSNPTVGVMAGYLLAALAVASALLRKSWTPLLRGAVATVLGLGLTGMYLLPVIAEQGWADLKQVTLDPGQTLENNWLFARHADSALAFHDHVLYQASVVAVAMVALSLAALAACRLRNRLPGPPAWWIPLALVPPSVLFLLLPISEPLWNVLPELRFLQFPWRWLIVLEAPMAVFLIAAVWPDKPSPRWRQWAVAASCAAAFLGMTALANGCFYQPCDEDDAVPGMMAAYRTGIGVEGTGEYVPFGADNSLVAAGLPAACLVSDPATVLGRQSPEEDAAPVWEPTQGGCLEEFPRSPIRALDHAEHFGVLAVLDHSGYLVLRLRSYPAWQVRVNGHPAGNIPRRADGLLAVPVAEGPLTLTADWQTTPDVVAGRWVSGISLLLLTALCSFARKLSRPRLSS